MRTNASPTFQRNRLTYGLLVWGFFLTFPLQAQQGMVVSARIEASRIGADVLQRGGNVFDAMVATELALAVAYPYAGNIGGGGFMVYRLHNGQAGSLDYREKAPLAAHPKMYLDAQGQPIPKASTEGATSVAVPGTVAGIFEAHRRFGTLPIGTLIQPAIDLALRGVVVTAREIKHISEHQPKIIAISGEKTLYAKPIRQGDTLRYLALAATLKRIKTEGAQAFYEGQAAQTLVAFLQKKGSIITLNDLKNYQAVWRSPITFQYKKWNIISMGPPSSGGVTLGQILGMLAPFDVKKLGHNSAAYVQLLTEAERRAYADRNHYLGDPDWVRLPLDSLMNDAYLKKRMRNFNWEKATPSSTVSYGRIQSFESDETTHYSIVDTYGNALAATTTLNGAYGSKLYCDELGFFLNNQMDDFSVAPGVPNTYGLIGSKANEIQPGKRMLSSMTPTIVEDAGRLKMVLGTPGGSTIITSVLQTLLNVIEFGMTMQQAVAAPRFHHQGWPDEIWLDPNAFSEKTQDTLCQKGYVPLEKNAPVIGKVDAIMAYPNGELEGGADPRGDDAAVKIQK